MTDKERTERDGLVMEIESRKELVKRLQHPLKLINEAARKERDKRAARVENASQYRDYNDALDAYGFGCITEEEFDQAVKDMELGEDYVENALSPVEVAAQELNRYVARLNAERATFEFDILPPEEQARIRQKNEEIMAKRALRKEREVTT